MKMSTLGVLQPIDNYTQTR